MRYLILVAGKVFVKEVPEGEPEPKGCPCGAAPGEYHAVDCVPF